MQHRLKHGNEIRPNSSYTLKEVAGAALGAVAAAGFVLAFAIFLYAYQTPTTSAYQRLMSEKEICKDIRDRNVGVSGATKEELTAYCLTYGISI